MKIISRVIVGAMIVGLACFSLAYFVFWDATVHYGSMAINYVRYMSAPPGTLVTETSPDYKAPQTDDLKTASAAIQPGNVATTDATSVNASATTSAGLPQATQVAADNAKDWPSYNRTLTSNRFSPLDEITPKMPASSRSCAPTTPANTPASTPAYSRSTAPCCSPASTISIRSILRPAS